LKNLGKEKQKGLLSKVLSSFATIMYQTQDSKFVLTWPLLDFQGPFKNFRK